MNSFLGSIRGEVPEENDMRSFQNDVLTVDFDKVQAIGDIMLINPRDIKKVTPEPPMPETVSPRQNPQQPPQQPPKPETQPQFENKPNFE